MNKLFDTLAALEIPKVILAGLVISAAYWNFIYNDGSSIDSQIAGLNQQLSVEENKKKDTDNTLKLVRDMQEKVGQLSLKYQEISKRLPSALYSIDINRAIDDFARGSGVSVKSKKPAEVTRGEVVEEVPVEVSLEGSYAQLSRFLFLVSSAEKMSRVKNVSMVNSSSVKFLKFTGSVVGYKLAPEKMKPSSEGQNGEAPAAPETGASR